VQITETGRPAQAEIKNMAVDPSHQGRGIGRALIAAAIARARDERRSWPPRRPTRQTCASTSGSGSGSARLSAMPSRPRRLPAGPPGDGIELSDRVWLDLHVDRQNGTMPTARSLMTPITDDDLYARAAATLLASWQQIARGSSGAALLRLGGVATAVFAEEPERGVYNSALLDRDLGATERARAVDAMQAAYSAAGIERYAA
jgi:hypothetical protein